MQVSSLRKENGLSHRDLSVSYLLGHSEPDVSRTKRNTFAMFKPTCLIQ